jgi:hypothetical protein
MSAEDIAESMICATMPGSSMWYSAQTDFGIQDLALACAGMPRVYYLAALYRVTDDHKAYVELWSRLAGLALCDPHRAVRKRAGMLATLVLAEDRSAGLIEKIGLIPPLLRITRSQYYRDVRPVHLDLRARLDGWARSGLSWIARRAR